MFKIMVEAHTQRGIFCGNLPEFESEDEAKEFLLALQQNINKLERLSLESMFGEHICLNKIIIETTVFKFWLEEVQ